jgi:predicted transposase YbfD/YdcC
MKILALIIVLISINSYAMADNKVSTKENDNYYFTLKEKYTKINEQITASLNSVKTNVDKIIEYHNKINETVKEEEDIKIKYKNNKSKKDNALEKLETVRNQIHLKYKDIASSIEFIYKSGDFWNISQQKFTTDRRKLSSVIDKWIKKYSENKFEACFNDKTYVKYASV